jgi:hypothetical protein
LVECEGNFGRSTRIFLVPPFLRGVRGISEFDINKREGRFNAFVDTNWQGSVRREVLRLLMIGIRLRIVARLFKIGIMNRRERRERRGKEERETKYVIIG